MTPEEDGMRSALRQVLVDNGVDQLSNIGLHSWRCDYYLTIDPAKGGGPCDCVDELLDGLVMAVTPFLTDPTPATEERSEP